MPNIHFNINLSQSQKEAYELAHRKDIKYLTLVWSRQSGKTILMQVLCVEWLLKKNVQIGYICRNYILAKKIYKNLVRIIPKSLIHSANGSDLTIESVYGSTLTLYSAESGASLRGQTFDYLICDEFAFFKQEQTDGTSLWNDILSPTVKAKGKKVIFVSTPLGKNNLFYEMYLRGISNDYPKYVSLRKDIYSDGFVTPQDIEEIKKSIPELSFRQEYLTEFLDSANTIFAGFEHCFEDFNYNDNLKTWIGIDISSTDGDKTVLTKINTADQVKCIEIKGTLDQKYRQMADIIDGTPNLVSAYLEINSLGLPIYNEVRKLIKHKGKLQEWTTTNSSKEEIVSAMAVKIANKDIHFDNNDKELYKELGQYGVSFSKTGRMIFNGINAHDDYCMSLCIANRCKDDKKYVGNMTINFARGGTKKIY